MRGQDETNTSSHSGRVRGIDVRSCTYVSVLRVCSTPQVQFGVNVSYNLHPKHTANLHLSYKVHIPHLYLFLPAFHVGSRCVGPR